MREREEDKKQQYRDKEMAAQERYRMQAADREREDQERQAFLAEREARRQAAIERAAMEEEAQKVCDVCVLLGERERESNSVKHTYIHT